MTRFLALLVAVTLAIIVSATLFSPTAAAPLSEADKAALKKATADCRAEVKERARFEEMSWYERHKRVKNCVKNALGTKSSVTPSAAKPSGM